MKKIKKAVEHINEELDGAKEYAERYIECKAKGNMANATKFKEMASQELNHAMILHDMLVKEVEELEKVYTIPEGMQEVYDSEHKKYVEKSAWIKQMLAM